MTEKRRKFEIMSRNNWGGFVTKISIYEHFLCLEQHITGFAGDVGSGEKV
jgi:hypothetical protein